MPWRAWETQLCRTEGGEDAVWVLGSIAWGGVSCHGRRKQNSFSKKLRAFLEIICRLLDSGRSLPEEGRVAPWQQCPKVKTTMARLSSPLGAFRSHVRK